ncbi:2-(R)-hydroxypropyl-CoM dehydrogenase-like [Teleopsis dalmanni]|uniref:2-(R)-hydroxypropyl-CoM dehydrogenase-like n=1 Tax=Teleopsis dalmanni TaxID=139649 RepID=UPI000D32A3B9|nr:2-(R)-hydroxypropyl-CoM dehydrogenase-like [Teleopsis dalmanni]XP_037947556.1 2-(R)-hydroxypropyl-CoM dehydrogenase-like [Teleopsis dalmanni]
MSAARKQYLSLYHKFWMCRRLNSTKCDTNGSKLKLDFKDKVVFITGASSGIGAQTAADFAQLGAKLALVGRSKEGLEKTAQRCKSKEKPLTLQADLQSECDIQTAFEETIQKYKRLDVLVNGAGIMEMGSIESTNLEQYDRTMQTNLRSMYQLCMLAAPELIKTKGCIVNISSVCGVRSFSNLVAYNISKSGVDQLTKSVALDLGLKGVRCNCVNPGTIVTNLQKRGGMDEEAYKALLERGKQSHALGRNGNPTEVSSAICFLASEMASFITAVQLSVDGGRHALCPR